MTPLGDLRDQLARLVAKRAVMRRDGPYERGHPNLTRPFVKDIERRAARFRNGMDTIRPNKRRKKR